MYARRLIALAALAGCATIGTRFEWSDVDALRPGMTRDEVNARLGKPNNVTTVADGRFTEGWIYSRGTALGTGNARRVIILFDADGKMVRVVSRTDTELR